MTAPSEVDAVETDSQPSGLQVESSKSHVICNLCGADNFDVVVSGWQGPEEPGRSVSRLWADVCAPRRGELDHEIALRSDPGFLGGMLERKHDTRMEKEKLQVRDFKKTRRWLAARFPQRGHLLEIGCGLGFLLEYFVSDGWTGLGLDPDRLCCEHARQILGLTVQTGTLPAPALSANSADVVLMMHVLEHVDDPRLTLAEIYRILKPGGVVVLETPRYDTLMIRFLRHRERSVSCNGHIFFFTSSTL